MEIDSCAPWANRSRLELPYIDIYLEAVRYMGLAHGAYDSQEHEGQVKNRGAGKDPEWNEVRACADI
ncbi:unnamed protein product [Didymodactylos carnosus]|uniref:Uncharacterized protein n=1 Tax=Didymodactylos carnosus TaxID=1234261 RepID=A0A815KU43_9BILA|nr:unnamed protein product [Didymodactylos carnosus]CAF4288572.1 unnamed protein product [Didymodactylos carnosus]